jgi:hypothetical protein
LYFAIVESGAEVKGCYFNNVPNYTIVSIIIPVI